MGEMTKLAVNIMGYIDDKTDSYSPDTMDQLIETIKNLLPPLQVFTVSTKELPPNHIIIDKKKTMRRTTKLGMILDKHVEKSKK